MDRSSQGMEKENSTGKSSDRFYASDLKIGEDQVNHEAEEIKERKKELRRKILSARKGLTEEMRRQFSNRIVERIRRHPRYQRTKVISAYLPFGDEVDILPLLEKAREEGKKILIPRVHRESLSLSFHEWRGVEGLVRGSFGILEPPPSAIPYQGEEADLLLIPGVAFDRKGGRLGYGRGYFDRFLEGMKSSPYLLAPSFAIQVVEEVPMEPWDKRIDAIVTETEWIDSSYPFMYNEGDNVEKNG
ncbi:5,10-methenyltetrahydrofolate synthetase (modular protein) [[Clostridium] ultunense Esp]|nr:5,10-methenyltetrahydrofolate synthetase (modular protein) [[Clostridium] ultunense Esp]